MSRIIVKGLPKYTTEDDLRKHFSKNGGSVTDVKLMKKPNGESRRFAFIGYKSDEDAKKATSYYNKSFIDTARIDVELAKTFSDPSVPLSFREKRHRDEDRLRKEEETLLQQQQEQEKRKKQKFKSSVDEALESDPKLREFMEVMKPSHQVKSWANDATADGSGGPSATELEKALAEKDNGESKTLDVSNVATVEAGGSDDEYEDFNKRDDDDDEDEEMIPLGPAPTEINDQAEELENIAANENVSDLDWLKSRRIRMNENGDQPPVEEEKPAEAQKKQKPVKEEPKEVSVVDKIRETGRLFIRNILYDSTEEDFKNLFSKYGELEEVHIAVDTRTGKSKGFVHIQFKNSENAVLAYVALDKQIFQGRLLHILPGQAKKSHRLDEFDLKNMPLKKQRELKRKDQAHKSQFSWNSLYMNNDAVLESVASKMGVTKAQLIDPQNSSSAVKQALAEAHVIGDVRKYFESKGVDLLSFDKKERDDKIILVKNFPFGTTLEEIGELFAQYGQLKRILMPPAGTIAVVEFRDLPSARKAFTKLAYRRFKQGILYLEKGPKDLFTREPSLDEGLAAATVEKEEAPVEAKVTAEDIQDADSDSEVEDAPAGPTVSVFVKNLNFSTTAGQLTGLFKSLPGFVIATVKTKPDPKNAGKVLSMGFGFVEFKTKEDADVAVTTLNGHVLDGHRLQLKLSHRQGTASKPKASKDLKSNKIIIKNLPFEATRKDLLELFGSFGSLKSVRVPKKFDKSARGFAFVEYNLLKEAELAMDQLQGVHLLGRRLVMQYAEHDTDDAEEEIERMTKKVAKSVATQQMAAARLAGKGKIELEEKADEFEGF